MRTIAHIDLDAFYVSVELLRRPRLRGRPVVVAGGGPRAVVTTASYEARRFGVGSAMPASRARRLCPQAIFVPPDFGAYRRASAEVMARVHGAAEIVEVAGLDEAYLDLSGMVAPHAAMRRLVAAIRRECGIGASVGIGPGKLVAKMASDADKPGGFVVLSREQAAARFAAQRPGLIPGIGPKTDAELARLGITTIAALAGADERPLVERFGPRAGPYLRRRARFEDDAPLCPVRHAVSESRERTFDEDVADHARLARILAELAGGLGERLAREGRRWRTVGIKVRLDDFSTHTRARTREEPSDDPAQLTELALALLHEFSPRRPVRLLGVRAAGFERDRRREADPQLALPL